MQWCYVESRGWALVRCSNTTSGVCGRRLFSLQQRGRRYSILRQEVILRSRTSSIPGWSSNVREHVRFWNHCELCGEYGERTCFWNSLVSTASKCDAASLVRLSRSFHRAGNGDGILICDACQGEGMVATKVCTGLKTASINVQIFEQITFENTCAWTSLGRAFTSFVMQPGGAGVPFYIGNAQCSVCKGHGFEPCPVCIGYQADLPAPAPHGGPRSSEKLGNHLSIPRWLRSFPDSRAKRTRRWAVLCQDTTQPIADACWRRQWCRARLRGESESR